MDPSGGLPEERHVELKLTGARVVKIRPMTDDERALEGWESIPGDILAGEYDNGAVVYPACADCGRPADVWALYGGTRWKIEPLAEADTPCPPPPVVRLPRWVAITLIVGLVVAVTALILLWRHDHVL